MQCNRRRLCFYKWQFAQHAANNRRLHCRGQSTGNLAAVKHDTKDRGPGQGNKAEKKKHETFKTLLVGWAGWGGHKPECAPPPPPPPQNLGLFIIINV